MKYLTALAIALTVTVSTVHAQTSTSFQMEEYELNSGGTPESGAGSLLTSASFKIKLSSLGTGLVSTPISSASYQIDTGMTAGLLPPGEVGGVLFTAKDTLAWDLQRTSGTYNLYRDLHANLTGPGFGQCLQQGLTGTSAIDPDPVPAGSGYFYLVTGRNSLGEEGSKGSQSDGSQRLGNVCP